METVLTGICLMCCVSFNTNVYCFGSSVTHQSLAAQADLNHDLLVLVAAHEVEAVLAWLILQIEIIGGRL